MLVLFVCRRPKNQLDDMLDFMYTRFFETYAITTVLLLISFGKIDSKNILCYIMYYLHLNLMCYNKNRRFVKKKLNTCYIKNN